MKNITEYINEARIKIGSLKWGSNEWGVIEKVIAHVNDNPKHKEWYAKMEKDKNNGYDYNLFSTSSPLLNGLDNWQYLQKNGGKKVGYWTPDGCSEFSGAVLPSIYYVLNSEYYFHHEDPSKDDYTDEDIKTMNDMCTALSKKIPSGGFLSGRDKVLKIVEPIVTKYNGCKIKQAKNDWNAVWVTATDFDSWSKCLDELEEAFDNYKNVVTGDGQFNSIYIDY